MVGDHPVADIGGATAAGIPACMLRTRWFQVPHGVRAVERLHEVFA
jgi:ribonucleotide monophosphatase NagD (HAD superfamily)